MKTGIIIYHGSEDMEQKFARAKELGFSTCQLSSGNHNLRTQAQVEHISSLSKKYNVEITAVIGGWSGPNEWNFYGGPVTLGLLPAAYRATRLKELEQAIDFASALSVPDVNTHIGFIPENPNDPTYPELVGAVRYLCGYAKGKNVNFCMETGQETPITLLRFIKDTKAENIGINLDPANLLMYGKANPIDALSIIGAYIKGVHGKDGEYPQNPYELGNERAIGDGMVCFERFIPALKAVGYDGAITVEREISGEQQEKDIIHANKVLNNIISSL